MFDIRKYANIRRNRILDNPSRAAVLQKKNSAALENRAARVIKMSPNKPRAALGIWANPALPKINLPWPYLNTYI